MAITEVLTVADARQQLTALTRKVQGRGAAPIYYGSHRKPQAVIVSVERYEQLAEAERRLMRERIVRQSRDSTRLEGGQFSTEFERLSQDFIDGALDIDTMGDLVRAQYGDG